MSNADAGLARGPAHAREYHADVLRRDAELPGDRRLVQPLPAETEDFAA